MLIRRFQQFVRIWRKSPIMALTFLRRKATRQAKRLIPTTDDWNKNWLGEEMRPFNSLRQS
jgi:hypothetical protein